MNLHLKVNKIIIKSRRKWTSTTETMNKTCFSWIGFAEEQKNYKLKNLWWQWIGGTLNEKNIKFLTFFSYEYVTKRRNYLKEMVVRSELSISAMVEGSIPAKGSGLFFYNEPKIYVTDKVMSKI